MSSLDNGRRKNATKKKSEKTQKRRLMIPGEKNSLVYGVWKEKTLTNTLLMSHFLKFDAFSWIHIHRWCTFACHDVVYARVVQFSREKLGFGSNFSSIEGSLCKSLAVCPQLQALKSFMCTVRTIRAGGKAPNLCLKGIGEANSPFLREGVRQKCPLCPS